MDFKPFGILDEHDIVNQFALAGETGAKGTPVSISVGWNNSQKLTAVNSLPGSVTNNGNVWSPTWAVTARVTPTVSGNKPFGVQLYDVLAENQFGYPMRYDKTRKDEAQAVLSGQSVPIARKGTFLVGPWGTGDGVAAGKFVQASGTGGWGVAAARTGVSGVALPIFGEFYGGLDNDGYALVHVNCYL